MGAPWRVCCWCDLDGPVKVCQIQGTTLSVWDEGGRDRTARLRDGVVLWDLITASTAKTCVFVMMEPWRLHQVAE